MTGRIDTVGRYKYLLKNIGILTLGSFATKLLSFFLVPLYTNILTTAEYGTYDLFNTTIGVLLPILTMNIQDSVLRFALDNQHSRTSIVSVGVRYLLIGSGITALGLAVNSILNLNGMLKEYAVFFFLMFFMQALSGILLSYSRGTERVSDLAVSGVISSAVAIGCNIVFLVVFQWGLVGYFLANLSGSLVQCLYLILRGGVVHEVDFRRKYSRTEKEMLVYCRPLIANSIAWWVNNTSDRYIVVFFCGLAENGIYAVGSKIPSILNLFQSIFNQAWAISVVKDFDPEDKSGFFTNTYKAYNCMMVILCSAIIVADKMLARFLYAKDFYLAWRFVPWLTIAIVFGALSGYLGGFFSAVKYSKIFATSTIIGAVTNLILNLIFTPIYGAMGAAVATAICYFIVWIFRYHQSKKYIRIRINIKRDLFSYVLLAVQGAVLCLFDGSVMYGAESIIFLTICLLYISDIAQVIKKVLRGKAT